MVTKWEVERVVKELRKKFDRRSGKRVVEERFKGW